MTNESALDTLLHFADAKEDRVIRGNEMLKVTVALRQLQPALARLRKAVDDEKAATATKALTAKQTVEARVKAALSKPKPGYFSLGLESPYGEALRYFNDIPTHAALEAARKAQMDADQAARFKVAQATASLVPPPPSMPMATAVQQAHASADTALGAFLRKHLEVPHGAATVKNEADVVKLSRPWYEQLRERALKAAQGVLVP